MSVSLSSTAIEQARVQLTCRVDVSDEVEEILNRVKGKVAALDKLHAKHVLPGFNDRSAEEREIERATTEITRVSNEPRGQEYTSRA